MSVEPPRPLGSCPHCDTEIPPRQLLIQYETSLGEPAIYAECPSCLEVVSPE